MTPSSAGPTGAKRLLHGFAVLYGLDASLTACDEILAWLGAGHVLLPLRNAVGLAALAASALVYAWMAGSVRPPKRVLVPPILLNFWLAFGALPFGVTEPDRVGAIAALSQCAAAVYLFLGLRRTVARQRRQGEPALAAGGFRFWPSLGFVAANVVLGPACLVALLVLTFTRHVEASSEGFVSFDWSGVNLGDRRYVRDDRSIRLIGMMHIGELDHYQDLFRTFDEAETVVLSEGVTDNENLLQTFGYGRVAESLGLAVQPRVEEVLEEPDLDLDSGPAPDQEWPHIEHADLDISDFNPETVELLNRIGRLWNLGDPREQLREFLEMVQDPRAEEWPKRFQSDLLDKRNQHLLGRIDQSIARYRNIVVPWGGLHLPGIEAELLSRGFHTVESRHRRLLSYRTVIAALAARLRPLLARGAAGSALLAAPAAPAARGRSATGRG